MYVLEIVPLRAKELLLPYLACRQTKFESP
jgi:hypothetical protein